MRKTQRCETIASVEFLLLAISPPDDPPEEGQQSEVDTPTYVQGPVSGGGVTIGLAGFYRIQARKLSLKHVGVYLQFGFGEGVDIGLYAGGGEGITNTNGGEVGVQLDLTLERGEDAFNGPEVFVGVSNRGIIAEELNINFSGDLDADGFDTLTLGYAMKNFDMPNPANPPFEIESGLSIEGTLGDSD